ncbi:hypothetical protein D3C72_1040320 [compost metagenome]
MSVQDKRAPGLYLGPVGADHIERVFVRHGDRAEPRMRADVLHVDLPAVHGKAALAHRFVQEVLRGVLLLAQRGKAHQILRESQLRIEVRVNGLQNAARLFLGQRRGRHCVVHDVSLSVKEMAVPGALSPAPSPGVNFRFLITDLSRINVEIDQRRL